MSFASTIEASTAVNVVRTGPRGGTPVVLLHPAGLDLSYWDRQLDALRDRALKTLLHDDPLVQAAMWEMIASFDRVADLVRISCPTLVLAGELDEVTPLASARLLRDGIPHATLAVIPNSAHMSQLEQPHLVNRHLLSFLQATA